MRLIMTTAAVLAAAPVIAQVTSPFVGPLPNTVILDGGWQMTPQANRCMLTHRGSGPGQDMAIIAPLHSDKIVLALVLPTRGAFTAPVQVTVVAQGDSAEQIGRVTFDATSGALGTLLMADWPADSLLPRVVQAKRLNFYTPDHRLIRSVMLDGSAAAVDTLNACRGVTAKPQSTAPNPNQHHVIDLGWVPEFDHDGCGIRRMTRDGNEFGLRYTRRDGMVAVYRMHKGPRYDQGEAVPIRFGFWQSGGNGSPVEIAGATLSVTMHSTNPGDGPVLFAPGSNPLLGKLRLPDLSTLTISSAPAPAGRVDDIVNLSGSVSATQGLAVCMRMLPK